MDNLSAQQKLMGNMQATSAELLSGIMEERGRGFASDREAWAQLKENIENVESRMKAIKDVHKDMWSAVKDHNGDAFCALAGEFQRSAIPVGHGVDECQRAGKHRGAARGGRMMTRSELLHAAEVCVCGQREEDYGTPEDSFRVIGELWETYIKEKCVGDPAAEVCIVPEDVAALLALLKIARIATGHGKSDNWVDLAGYAACGGELQSRPAVCGK